LENFSSNKAYLYQREGSEDPERLLETYKERYKEYRRSWHTQPQDAITALQNQDNSWNPPELIPLCVDIEIAAICDLACPFCYRQHIVTPDKVIDPALYHSIIDQCSELGVPSIKLNWRGEPLLHPKISEFVSYAKKKGILDVIINTNATTLTSEKSRSLIDSGLDQMIYSFDGASASSYEKLRIGRFEHNSFEKVYENIRCFKEIRTSMNAFFPRTRIQMILTEETFHEQKKFIELFKDCVDDVSVKAYTERGGNISDLEAEIQQDLLPTLKTKNLPLDSPYWRDMSGRIAVATGRKPCAQPFQRMMITYDGRVSMCCYDWGSEHPIGFVSEKGFLSSRNDLEKTNRSIRGGKRGFGEFMASARLPEPNNHPNESVSSLAEIWQGHELERVRKMHCEGKIDSVPLCKGCQFKETYTWLELR